ncbi:hypothetical protein D3C78_1712600 [compost metagenome]
MFTGKQFACAAKTGGDLVGNQQDLVAIAQLPHALQIGWMIDPHPTGSLDYRLQDHRGYFPGVLLQ